MMKSDSILPPRDLYFLAVVFSIEMGIEKRIFILENQWVLKACGKVDWLLCPYLRLPCWFPWIPILLSPTPPQLNSVPSLPTFFAPIPNGNIIQ